MLATKIMITTTLTHQEQLNKDLRWFATMMPVRVYTPSRDKVITTVELHLPEALKNATETQDILDTIGLVVISQPNPKLTISWSAADNKEDAQKQLEKYSQPEYKKVRDALNIDYHWILLVSEDTWGNSSNCLIEAHITFEQYGKPDCCILEL
jgi:hypothetical protein